MILGSGMSYHNMAGFGEPDAVPASKSFDEDLAGLCAKNGTHEERKNAVNNWTKMRHARECHPREEHLIPLFTCLGASDGKAGYQAKLWMLGVHVSDYVFE
jgi:aromatic ring-opening dioxygenase catalytic subunit (LigB family)